MAETLNEDFVRQRRNLMIVSLAILFSETTNLTIQKINIFGTELFIGNPQSITTVLWIGAFYWLVRFYQYSHAVYPKVLRNAVNERIRKNQFCAPVALRRLLRDEPSLLEPFADLKTTPTLDYKSATLLNTDPNFIEIQLELRKFAVEGERSINVESEARKVTVDGADIFWLKVRAWIHFIFRTPLFTNLVMPYLVFSAPVLYAGYKAIH